MTTRSIAHARFTIERNYPHTPAQVFAAFSDKEKKRKWFGGAESEASVWSVDFREGGVEQQSGPFLGHEHSFLSIYHEILENKRIVYSYVMNVDGVKLSASLTTIEFEIVGVGDGAGCYLRWTECGAFFDEHEDPRLREHGTAELLDALGAALEDLAPTE